MKKSLRKILLLSLGMTGILSCQEIDDVYTYGNEGASINWNDAADKATESLIVHFWHTSNHYFVYNNDDFDGNTSPGYWPQAHAMDVVIDAYIRTGNTKYSQLFGEWYEGIKSQNNYQHNTGYRNYYYDDSEWIALTMLRLYDVTKDEKYLNTAKDLWEWIKTGWNDLGGGGIAWENRSHLYSKNACSNGPAAILAARLYRITKDESDLEWAKKIYDWEKAHLFNPATGAVYDNLDTRTDQCNTVTFSYNQGTFLGAGYELFKITGEANYLNEARKAAYYCISNSSMIDTGNNILRNEGEGDGGLFKGIFMRYFVQLILEPSLAPVYSMKFKTFFDNNALVLWTKGAYQVNLLFGPNWASKVMGSTQLTSHTSGCTMLEAKAYYELHKSVQR